MSPSGERDKPGGRGWHDQYGNGLEPWLVEKTGPRTEGFEEELISELHVLELLKHLPEMQRLAIEKRLAGIPLNQAERQALRRSKETVTKWLEIETKPKGVYPSEHPQATPD